MLCGYLNRINRESPTEGTLKSTNITLSLMSDTQHERYMAAVNRLLSLADFERKSRADQPPDWHLRRVERLMSMLGNPHLATPVVHVAGSKGKGSTCAMIASGLKAAGFKVGLYTSPHLHSFTERIQIGGENISKLDFTDLIDELWPFVDQVASAIDRQGDLGVVSVFEMLTAMAFVHFRRIEADFAVIETGLGGRLDATNIVDPEVAVITPISLDHVRILGDKISLIAGEKAGIIKQGRPAIVAKNHPAAWKAIRERAEVAGSDLVSACAAVGYIGAATNDPLSGDLPRVVRQEFILKRWNVPDSMTSSGLLRKPPDPGLVDVRIRSRLLGSHQIDNARTAAATFNVLYRQGHEFDVNVAIRGIENVDWPCRSEVLDIATWPPIILDGAHNDASLKALQDTIHALRSREFEEDGRFDRAARYVLIIGATEGHEFESMALELAKSAFCTIATQSRHPKSSHASRLVEAGRKHGLEFSMRPSVGEALRDAKRIVDQNHEIGLIVVTGSLFVAAEAREDLLGIEPEIYDDLKQPYMVPYVSIMGD